MRKKLWSNSTVKNVLAGIAVGLLLLLAGAFIGAYIIHKEMIEINGRGYISVIVLLAAAFLASLIGMRGAVGKERLLAGAVTGLGLWLAMLGCNLLVCDSGLSGVWVTVVLILASSTSGFLLFQNRGTKKKYKIPKL